MNELITITWAVTSKCNYNCHYCYARYDYHNESLDMKDSLKYTIIKKLKELSKTNPIRLIILGGEPTLYDGLSSLCKEVIQFCKFVTIVTNGTNIELLESLPRNISIMLSYHGQDVDNFTSIIKTLAKKHNIEIACVIDPKCIENVIRLGNWCKNNNISIEMIPMLHNETQESEVYTDELLSKLYTDVYYYNPNIELFNDEKLSCIDIYKKCRYNIFNKQNKKIKLCLQPSLTISVNGFINPTCPTGQLTYRTHISDDKAFRYHLVCDFPRCLLNRGAMDLSGWRI